MKRVLFVCTGNTCRSPLAEYLLREKLGQNDEKEDIVRSAGIAAMDGFPASEPVRQLLRKKGIYDEHVSQSVREELIDWADLILTMTNRHAEVLRDRFAEKAAHIQPLKTYVLRKQGMESHSSSAADRDDDSHDIIDPFGGSIGEYEVVMDELDALLDTLVAHMSDE